MKQSIIIVAILIAATAIFIGDRRINTAAKTASVNVPTASTSASDQCPQKKCGSGGFFQKCMVPDEWIVPISLRTLTGRRALFYKACGKHDDCYDTYGANKAQCDRKFLSDLEDECGRAYNTIIEKPAKEVCNGAAKIYYQAVSDSAKAAEAFRDAQNAAARHQTYLVTVTTGNVDKAGTDSRVFISLYGSSGDIIDEYINPPGDSWERGQTDQSGISRDVGDIRRIRMKIQEKGQNPGWNLYKVTIKNLKTKRVWDFTCDCWLARSHGTLERVIDAVPR